MDEKLGRFIEKCLYLQRERRNQVEPRCAERWHLRDDEQFDLAAWFLLPKVKSVALQSFTQIQSWSRVASFFHILMRPFFYW